MPRPRSWTDEQLVAAVAASRTLKEVHERLGLEAGEYDLMRAHIKRLGVDASHLPRGPKRPIAEILVAGPVVASGRCGAARRRGAQDRGV